MLQDKMEFRALVCILIREAFKKVDQGISLQLEDESALRSSLTIFLDMHLKLLVHTPLDNAGMNSFFDDHENDVEP